MPAGATCREESVVRTTSLYTAALLLALAVTTGSACASPASMAYGQPVQASSGTSSWTSWMTPWRKTEQPQAMSPMQPMTRPSESVSPWKHPINYMSATVSEMPGMSYFHKDKQPYAPVARPANDAISLNTPTGPPTAQLYISMAQLSEKQGNIAEARKQLQHAMQMWPNDVEVLRAAARMEDRQGQLALAESLYLRAVAINPQHAGALNDLGLCQARQGKLDQSVQSLEQAINLQPDKALYRNNAATVLAEMRQDQRALAHLSAVHGPAAANYNLGQMLIQRGRPRDAAIYFQAALEIDPAMEPARTALAQINGTPVTEPSRVASEPQTVPMSNVGPQLAPQQPAPQPSFPSTARGPAFGTSSYAAPAPSAPIAAAPAAPAYQTATAPRYLPPVKPVAPGSMVR
jgi:tetratricopeptide (TPR) repeat protein